MNNNSFNTKHTANEVIELDDIPTLSDPDFVRLGYPDSVCDTEAPHLIKKCLSQGFSKDVVYDQLVNSYVGAKASLQVCQGVRNLFRSELGESESSNFYIKRALTNLLDQRLSESSNPIYFEPLAPPSWLTNCLEDEFFRQIFLELAPRHPNNKLMQFIQMELRKKQQLLVPEPAQSNDQLELFSGALGELCLLDKDDFYDALKNFVDVWTATPLSYLTSQIVLQGMQGVDSYHFLRVRRELEYAVYSDPTKLMLARAIHQLLNPISNRAFLERLEQALTKPKITSNLVIDELYSVICGKAEPEPHAVKAVQKSILMDRLIAYTFLEEPPSEEILSLIKKDAISLICFIHTSDFNSGSRNVSSALLLSEKMETLYEILGKDFSEMLTHIDEYIRIPIMAYILIKFIQHNVKSSSYYSKFVDPQKLPVLHANLLKIAELHKVFLTDVIDCLFECLRAPTKNERELNTGPALMESIINTIIALFQKGEEFHILKLLKENISQLNDDLLKHTMHRIFRNIKPPFSLSFLACICELIIKVGDCRRHLVLQSGMLDVFIEWLDRPTDMKSTRKYPELNAKFQSLIRKVKILATSPSKK